MKNKAVTKKVLAVILAAGMTVSMGACAGSDSGNNSGDSGRISSESVVEDNQATEDTSGTPGRRHGNRKCQKGQSTR